MNSITQFLTIATPQIMMLLILIVAFYFGLFTRPSFALAVAPMKRESRTILVNVPRLKGDSYTLALEV